MFFQSFCSTDKFKSRLLRLLRRRKTDPQVLVTNIERLFVEEKYISVGKNNMRHLHVHFGTSLRLSTLAVPTLPTAHIVVTSIARCLYAEAEVYSNILFYFLKPIQLNNKIYFFFV